MRKQAMSKISTIDIPDYDIKKQLGDGGMATVYLAIHDRLQREVALKIMKPEIASNIGFQNSFMTEGRIVAKLEHPNILKIHDIDETNGYFYISTEVLRKGHLKRRLANGRLPLSNVLKITLQIADALSYAHQQGYIHRDIKPANIMFRENGDTVLTDFGLAKMQGTTGDMTQMGYIAGTPFYMSPEQGTGSSKIDQRADIYSLGVVFYEMLTGDKPYTGMDTVPILYEHVNTSIPNLQGENTVFQSIINKALAKKPEDRFNTIEDFAISLEKIDKLNLNSETIVASHTRVTSNKIKQTKKIIAGLVIISLSLGAWFYIDKLNFSSNGKQQSTIAENKVSNNEKNPSPFSLIEQEQKINRWITGDDKTKWIEAIKGLKKSAQTKDVGALIWLGYVYETGRGVDINWGKAWDYYANAIQQGASDQVKQRKNRLERKANQILQSKNTSQDERNKAYQIITAIANKREAGDNTHAWMAYRYRSGDGVTLDKRQADWWQKKYDTKFHFID
jgi:serine/threonine protein kinase